MPDDQNTTQNQDSTENSIPLSPQEPTEPAPENTAHSEPSTMPSEAPESPRDSADAIPVNNIKHKMSLKLQGQNRAKPKKWLKIKLLLPPKAKISKRTSQRLKNRYLSRWLKPHQRKYLLFLLNQNYHKKTYGEDS